jgi:xanthine dehydrogenase accessory factor
MPILEDAYRLMKAGEPFALVTVVRAEKPTSAKPGAKAIVTAGGELVGWVGGSCAEPTVKLEAVKSLEDGRSRLLRLCPPEKRGQMPQEGVLEVTLTCISGGTLEIYIEPQLAQPHLLVIGHLATTEALARLANAMDFRVTVMGLEATRDRFPQVDQVLDRLDFSQVEVRPNSYIVVASHGNYDEDALEGALRTNAGYVALVSSKTRAQAILQYLRDSNLPPERVAQLKYPAGLDLGAISPEEIALSILAEIVQLHRRPPTVPPVIDTSSLKAEEPSLAKDPVCGMTVEVASARYTSHYGGENYYFCAKSCQVSFEREPGRYLETIGGT